MTDIFMGHVMSGMSGLRTIKQLIVWAGGCRAKRGEGWADGGGFSLEAGVRTEVSADKETTRDEKDERVSGGTNGGDGKILKFNWRFCPAESALINKAYGCSRQRAQWPADVGI
jgi:hypothetical protein